MKTRVDPCALDECLFVIDGKRVTVDNGRVIVNQELKKCFGGREISVQIYRQLVIALIHHYCPQYYRTFDSGIIDDEDSRLPIPVAQAAHSSTTEYDHYAVMSSDLPKIGTFEMEKYFIFSNEFHIIFLFGLRQAQRVLGTNIFSLLPLLFLHLLGEEVRSCFSHCFHPSFILLSESFVGLPSSVGSSSFEAPLPHCGS